MFARDAFGFSLGYYHNADVTIGTNTTTHSDYKAINPNKNLAAERFYADITGSDVEANRNNLFNGNIGHMVTTITEPRTYTAAANETPNVLPMGNAYRYDQLNRLVESKSFLNLDPVQGSVTYNAFGFTGTYNNLYYNKFTYDANGNILNQVRHDNTGQVIDDMTYRYARNNANQIIRNRLYHVNDAQSNTALFDDDIDDMGAFTQADIDLGNTNYAYDEEGRLIKDVQEGIEHITWRVDGKVSYIHRPNGSGKKELGFDYDAMGNRIAKHVYDDAGVWISSTYYVRDAQGNVISVYERKIEQEEIDQTFLIAAINDPGQTDADVLTLLQANYPLDESVLIAYINSGRAQADIVTVLQGNAPLSDNVLIAIVQSSLSNANKAAAVGTQDVCDDVLLAVLGTGLPAGQAQNFFINQSPLSDAMLIALVNSGLPPGTIQNILLANLGLSANVIAAVNASTLPNGIKNNINNQNAGTTHTPVNNACDGSIQNNAGTVPVLSYMQAERHIYGSSRIGLDVAEKEMIVAVAPDSTEFERVLGYKQFEAVNHLGNVLVVFTDVKIPRDDNSDLTVDYFQPFVITAQDYSPFGVTLYGRSFESDSYRYGFNSMEKDDEVKGTGNSYTTEFRQLDPRLGRWLSIDPLFASFASQTPFGAFDCNPILLNDPSGLSTDEDNTSESESEKRVHFIIIPNKSARSMGTKEQQLANEFGYNSAKKAVDDYGYVLIEASSMKDAADKIDKYMSTQEEGSKIGTLIIESHGLSIQPGFGSVPNGAFCSLK